MDDEALLDLAAELAARAADKILAVRARGFETLRKPDASVVTAADHEAEALIVAGLREARPDIPVVAEEEIAAGLIPRRSDIFWLVDPLDGTREFAALGDDFAVNIGLVRHGQAVLGVVGIPARGEIFGGCLGGGAWKRTAAGQTRISARRVPPTGADVILSRRAANDPRVEAYLEGHLVASVQHMGSSAKFCCVAEGTADLYPRFGRTMEWDTAAPQAVVEAAGGSVRSLEDGTRLHYGKPGWENPPFVCAGLP
jgi:3'(2'), 5'-bisphosphate nucleotidase